MQGFLQPTVVAKPTPEIDLKELPDEQTMLELDLKPEEFTDFAKVFSVGLYQLNGMGVTKAIERVGIKKATFYTERWQALYAKAQRILMGRMTYNIRGAQNEALERFPDIIHEIIETAMQPNVMLRDKVDVAEFLYMAFVQNAKETKQDDLEERQYLQGVRNFNPMAPVHIANLTMNINTKEDEPPPNIIDTTAQ